MTPEEKKRYIIQHWQASSGEKISEMLKRYFQSLKDEKSAKKAQFLGSQA